MDLKTPLEALKLIYDLLNCEPEFDMLIFLLIHFGENSYATLVFPVQHSRYQMQKFTVYGESLPYAALMKQTSHQHNFYFMMHLVNPMLVF